MEMKEFLALIAKEAGNVEVKETESVLCIGRSAEKDGGRLCFVHGTGKDLLILLTMMCFENSHLRELVSGVAQILNETQKKGIKNLEDLFEKYKNEAASDESEEKSESSEE